MGSMGAPPKADDNSLREYDDIITSIVDYAYDYEIRSEKAWTRAKATLLDAIGAGIEGLHTSTELNQLIGPPLPGYANLEGGFKLPGTRYQLDILKGAFDMGAMVRYLDHNDAFPGAEWGHPSDNLGAILPTADILTRAALKEGRLNDVLTMKDVLIALIKAYEIQGCFQIKNSFNRVGLDHVILVKVGSAAMVSWLMKLSKEQAKAVVSHAWVDGHPLRTYRQAPNAGPRKGWAGGDACMRAVHLATLVKKGQPGGKAVLTTPRWGFYDVLYKGNSFQLPRPFGTWVIENVLFKVNTAEGHGMTAVECALQAADEIKKRGQSVEDIESIRVRTQEAAMIIINKQGPLHNAADRDHCLKYMAAVVMLKGAQIETEDYQDSSRWASDPRVETLRQKMSMVEDKQFTADYHNQDMRSLANAFLVKMKDGTELPEYVVEYPQGHVRREDTLDLVAQKAERNLGLKFHPTKVNSILTKSREPFFMKMPASEFMDQFVLESN